MVFDVMIKEVEKNAAGKDVFNVFRVHDAVLSKYLREVQDKGKYIVSVIPLFRKKEDRSIIDNEDREQLHIPVTIPNIPYDLYGIGSNSKDHSDYDGL